MTTITRAALILPMLCALIPVLSAQTRITGTARWYLKPADAEPIAGTRRAFRVLGAPTSIRFSMIISNDSPNAWEIDYARLRREFQFVSDRNVQLTATWPEEIVTATGVAPISLDSAIRVLPQEAVSLAVEVHQGQREPFVPGELVITATANDAFTDLRAVDGTQARIAFVHSTSISLRVGPPANNREQSTIFRRQADQVKSKNPLEAIRLLQLATAADPSDTRSLLELGEAYLDAKQYRNSIPIFQRVAQGRRLSGHSSVPYLLALGHVGDGNEAEARRVLRAAGISEEGVESSIRRFRITVSR